MLFWKKRRTYLLEKTRHVSILILLDVILEDKTPYQDLSIFDVSILILLDVILEVIKAIGLNVSYEFQSLFCWMLFWKTGFNISVMAVMEVSILILLDVILEERKPLFYQ